MAPILLSRLSFTNPVSILYILLFFLQSCQTWKLIRYTRKCWMRLHERVLRGSSSLGWCHSTQPSKHDFLGSLLLSDSESAFLQFLPFKPSLCLRVVLDSFSKLPTSLYSTLGTGRSLLPPIAPHILPLRWGALKVASKLNFNCLTRVKLHNAFNGLKSFLKLEFPKELDPLHYRSINFSSPCLSSYLNEVVTVRDHLVRLNRLKEVVSLLQSDQIPRSNGADHL